MGKEAKGLVTEGFWEEGMPGNYVMQWFSNPSMSGWLVKAQLALYS